MRQDWGMNEHGGDWRFRQYGRDEDRFEGRGRGWSRDDDQRERGYGERGSGERGYGERGFGMRDRDEWRSGNGGGREGWARRFEGEERERGRRFRSDDETRLERGEAPIVKVIEVVAQSPHSWEDATRRAIAEASRTIDDIKSIYVKDMQAIVTQGRIVEFRLVAKISFAVHDYMRSRSAGRRQYA